MLNFVKIIALLLCVPTTLVSGFSVNIHKKPIIHIHISNVVKVSTITATLVAGASTVNAADITAGQKIFEQSCASCHAGGNNAIAKQRTLKQDALNEYLLNPKSGSDIAKFIKDSNVHRGALAFSAKLDDVAYENVGHYVFTQAMENKW